MNVDITRIQLDQKDKLLNLYNLYLYDLSQYTGEDPQDNGEFDPTNTYLYLEREELYPFFLQYEEKTIGFILICSPPFVPEGIDYTVQELFLLKKYRGMNLASKGVAKVLKQFEGKISISQLEANKPAVNFWKKYYQKYNLKIVEEEENIEIEDLEGVHKVITQTFEILKCNKIK